MFVLMLNSSTRRNITHEAIKQQDDTNIVALKIEMQHVHVRVVVQVFIHAGFWLDVHRPSCKKSQTRACAGAHACMRRCIHNGRMG